MPSTTNELANWYAAGSFGSSLAVATCIRCTPEQAVRLAIARARERYPRTDWTQWKFTAEEFGFGRKLLLHFRVDTEGEPVRVH
ncbi:MAG: hypothetical protein EHM78_19420 [Myxococcaceae bacterium]|nr:MAG: hypothetical protein EHM78_19420 [Myxococcaceae bacterium]